MGGVAQQQHIAHAKALCNALVHAIDRAHMNAKICRRAQKAADARANLRLGKGKVLNFIGPHTEHHAHQFHELHHNHPFLGIEDIAHRPHAGEEARKIQIAAHQQKAILVGLAGERQREPLAHPAFCAVRAAQKTAAPRNRAVRRLEARRNSSARILKIAERVLHMQRGAPGGEQRVAQQRRHLVLRTLEAKGVRRVFRNAPIGKIRHELAGAALPELQIVNLHAPRENRREHSPLLKHLQSRRVKSAGALFPGQFRQRLKDLHRNPRAGQRQRQRKPHRPGARHQHRLRGALRHGRSAAQAPPRRARGGRGRIQCWPRCPHRPAPKAPRPDAAQGDAGPAIPRHST